MTVREHLTKHGHSFHTRHRANSFGMLTSDCSNPPLQKPKPQVIRRKCEVPGIRFTKRRFGNNFYGFTTDSPRSVAFPLAANMASTTASHSAIWERYGDRAIDGDRSAIGGLLETYRPMLRRPSTSEIHPNLSTPPLRHKSLKNFSDSL